MDSQVTAALIGLGGVVVGAVIGGFIANLRPNVRTVRGVARLLHAALSEVDNGSEANLPSDLWAEHRELLASELALADWKSVLEGYVAASRICAANAGGPTLEAEMEREAKTQLESALGVLSSLSGGWPWLTQIRRRIQ